MFFQDSAVVVAFQVVKLLFGAYDVAAPLLFQISPDSSLLMHKSRCHLCCRGVKVRVAATMVVERLNKATNLRVKVAQREKHVCSMVQATKASCPSEFDEASAV